MLVFCKVNYGLQFSAPNSTLLFQYVTWLCMTSLFYIGNFYAWWHNAKVEDHDKLESWFNWISMKNYVMAS